MKNSEIVNSLLFDYEDYSKEEIMSKCNLLPRKLIRWLAVHHPDNKSRKIFFRLTNVTIGEGSVLSPNIIVSDDYKPLLKIGKRTAIGGNSAIICDSNPNNSLLKDIPYIKEHLITTKEVIIEDDVWMGYNVVILPGVTIGKGSIIGAGSVVTKDVPPGCVYAGVPAKLIKEL